MNRVFTPILMAFAIAACMLADPPKKTKTAVKPTVSSANKSTKTASHSKPGSVSSANVKYARGRNGKLVRVARRSPPAPTYQLHPDPERYQQIQQALADRGYFKGEVNGVWGDDSIDALRHFQADQKLDDDGHLSALTLTGLGLGPKHDGTAPAAVTTPNAPTNSATKAGSATPLTPVANPPRAAAPPEPGGKG